MKTTSVVLGCVVAGGLWVASLVPATAALWLDEQAFVGFMEPGYYYEAGTLAAGYHEGSGFSFTVDLVGNTMNVVDFDSTGPHKVSGIGGHFSGVASLLVTLSDGTVFNPGQIADGFLGFTTDLPTTLWITSLSYSGPEATAPTVTGFVAGVDALGPPPIPETSTWVAGLLLVIPVLVQVRRVVRGRRDLRT